jgi:hypothetical protein
MKSKELKKLACNLIVEKANEWLKKAETLEEQLYLYERKQYNIDKIKQIDSI